MLTIVFPDDLCAAEISIRFMAELISGSLAGDVWLVMRNEIKHPDADRGN